MRACPGWQVYLTSCHIRSSYYAFRRNYRELRLALNVYKQPSITIESLWGDSELSVEKQMQEINRLTLNYLAASESLREHTRNEIIMLYSQHPFKEEYFKKREDDFAADLRCFVEGLRNYTLHRSLPLSIAEFTVQEDRTLLGRIMLNAHKLRENASDWKGAGKRYLASIEDQVDVGSLFAQHKTALAGFYNWLVGRLNEIHREELTELRTLHKQLREALREDRRST
jgi:hypothetical protein